MPSSSSLFAVAVSATVFASTTVMAYASPTTTEIAPGVHMPFVNLGGVSNRPSNYSLWIELGGRGLDSALTYGTDVQNAVGAAIKGAKVKRESLFLTTKIPCCPFDKYESCNGRKALNAAQDFETDLRELDVDYVDLVLLHWPCNRMEDTVAAYKELEPLIANGKTRAIGISNFNASMIEELLEQVTVMPAINQCGFSIANHHQHSILGRDDNTRKKCEELGITYAAYSPLGGNPGTPVPTNIDILHDPDVIAIGKKVKKSPAQVALRWVVQQGVVAVTASSKASHDLSDMDIFDFNLSDEEMRVLTAK